MEENLEKYTASISNLDEVKRIFYEHGLVIFKVIEAQTCDELILELWDKVIVKVPRKENNVTSVHEIQEVIHDRKKLVELLKLPALRRGQDSKKRNALIEKLIKVFPFHTKSFGASADPQIFNLPGVWRLREDPRLHAAASTIIGDCRLWVEINRSIHKLPGCGSAEFCHWDLNMQEEGAGARQNAKRKKREEEEEEEEEEEDVGVEIGSLNLEHWGKDEVSMINGKVMYTKGTFRFIPGTNKKGWFTDEKQKGLKMSPGPHKTSFSVKDDTTKKYVKRELKYIEVPAGYAVFWDSRLAHAVKTSETTGGAQWGTYLGFKKVSNDDQLRKYEEAAGKAKTDKIMKRTRNVNAGPEFKQYDELMRSRPVDELGDRKFSYQFNVAPLLYPSLDTIHYYPEAYDSYQTDTLSKLSKVIDASLLGKRQLQKGEEKVCFLPPPTQKDYVPYELSRLGRRLLGIESWPADDDYILPDDSAAVESKNEALTYFVRRLRTAKELRNFQSVCTRIQNDLEFADVSTKALYVGNLLDKLRDRLAGMPEYCIANVEGIKISLRDLDVEGWTGKMHAENIIKGYFYWLREETSDRRGATTQSNGRKFVYNWEDVRDEGEYFVIYPRFVRDHWVLIVCLCVRQFGRTSKRFLKLYGFDETYKDSYVRELIRLKHKQSLGTEIISDNDICFVDLKDKRNVRQFSAIVVICLVTALCFASDLKSDTDTKIQLDLNFERIHDTLVHLFHSIGIRNIHSKHDMQE